MPTRCQLSVKCLSRRSGVVTPKPTCADPAAIHAIHATNQPPCQVYAQERLDSVRTTDNATGGGVTVRIGIVVDSACDLPQDFIQRNNVIVLPISVRIGEAVLADHRDEEATLSFLQAHVAERGHEAETTPFSVNQIRDLFLQTTGHRLRPCILFDHFQTAQPDLRQRDADQLRDPQRVQARSDRPPATPRRLRYG